MKANSTSKRKKPPRLKNRGKNPDSLPDAPHRDLLHIEKHLFASGVQNIAGVDEVGRGCLAGPVFAGAVILPRDCVITGINDSKQLTVAERERLFHVIRARAVAWSVASVTADEIDRINIHFAALKAMAQAIARLETRPEYILIDGRFTLDVGAQFIAPPPQEAIINGDALSQSIAAASIMAKVCRDRWISEVGKDYPGFSFHRHKGYATEDHRREIETCGLTPLHRKSFRCV